MTDVDGAFAVLFSHASTRVYEDLVDFQRFTTRQAARELGERIARVQGVEYEVMERIDGQWRSKKGELPVEVIRRRWQVPT
ncbi:hypothetical protein ACFV6Y_38565 [Streptomyces massasporeus]|uniref:hypothetical protein n=1 Tax=Streptomyces massasporeus TaxID=67324 RepID=UPI00364B1B2F